MTEADFIIVGAGSAGCVLANRLTADGKNTVLLLEAGPRDRNPWIHVPLGVGKVLSDPSVNWLLKTVPEPNAKGRVLGVPRGKVLGGSSSINGCIYVRGNAADYDGWAQMGCRGWSFSDVLPYFRRAENFEDGADRFRGAGGPLNVAWVRDRDALLDGVLDAAAQAGYPRNPDVNGARQEGFTYSQTTTRGGLRYSAARAYLHPAAKRPNLGIETGVLATRILFEGNRATGVEFVRDGVRSRCRARREVILAAGSIHSPALLELSGIGDPEHLAQLGIPVVAASPEVGRNLQDHFAVWVKWRIHGHKTLNERTRGTRALLEGMRYLLSRRGALSYTAGPVMGFVRTRPELEHCDVQYHCTPLSFENPETRQLERDPGMTISSLVLQPQSRGHVHIRSPEAEAAPEIFYNAFSAQYDVDTIVAGIRILRDIARQPALERFRPLELSPGPEAVSDEELDSYVRTFGNACFHPVGTCRMGGDERSVVDPALRVRGVAGLRVVDASVMPRIPSGNTNAPVIMIAEKAAELILS